MQDIFFELRIILPELIILLGSMLTLIYGACIKVNRDKGVIVLTVCVMLVALYALSQSLFVADEVLIFNNMLVSNLFTGYAKFLLILSCLAVIIMMQPLMGKEKFAGFEIPVLIMISLLGMMFLVSSCSLISVYMSLEMMSLPIYIMAASDRDQSKSSEAGVKYFILGTLASGIFLLGTSMVYGFTGTINFAKIYEYYLNLNSEYESVVMPIGFLVGMVLILISFAFKISAVPFHMWTPDVYEGSPTLITAFMASAPKVAGFMILIRLLFDPFAELYGQWQQIIIFIAIASMLVGSLGAIMQKNFKRLLAYSSIGHVGFALVGLVTAESQGVQAVLLYLTIYISMTLAIFACLILLKKDGRSVEDIYSLAGLSKTCPNIALSIAILLLSMAGIPPFAGFFIKFYILVPVFKASMYGLAIVFVISSVIATFYYLKVIKIMYFDKSDYNIELLPAYSIKFIVLIGTLINLLYIMMPGPILDITRLVGLVLFK